MYVAHRINTVEELQQVPQHYGVELDLRDGPRGIHLSHDPLKAGESGGELFATYLQHYQHRHLILNIKSEGIEFEVLEMLHTHGIKDYFFLDSSLPMIIKLLKQGEYGIAVRLSEYESVETLSRCANAYGASLWVWVDCFTRFPLDRPLYDRIVKGGHRICVVSPELQGQPERIEEYRNLMNREEIYPDMICTKLHNISRWKPPVQVVVPMSGSGQRFVDAGYTDPKPLIVVDGKPMIQHVTELFPGEANITYICNSDHLCSTKMREILTRIAPACRIVSCQKGAGPVAALQHTFGTIDDNMETIVSYCDYGTVYNYDDFLLQMRRSGADGGITYYTGFHPHMLGTDHYDYAKHCTDEHGNEWMVEISQKTPFGENKLAEYASNGTYYFRNGAILKKYAQRLLSGAPSSNGEYYVSSIYNLMVADGLKTKLYRIHNMLQWGTPYDLECYLGWSRYFQRKESRSQLSGNFTMIVPLAGRGSRFYNYPLPKPLLPVRDPNESSRTVHMILASTADLPRASKYIHVCLQEHVEQYH